MLWRRVDPETGVFIEDVVLDAPPLLEDGAPDPAYIETPVPPGAGFYHPRWDGAAWVEGLSAEEIAQRRAAQPAPEPTPEERIAALEARNLDLMDTVAALAEIVIGGGET